MTQGNDSLEAKINALSMRIGNDVNLADPQAGKATASTLLYVDSSQKLAQGDVPFPVVLAAGSTNTGYSSMSIKGSATNSDNDLMHLTLVKGANATATIAGYTRITVTDAAGVITTGDYYMPFYTLA